MRALAAAAAAAVVTTLLGCAPRGEQAQGVAERAPTAHGAVEDLGIPRTDRVLQSSAVGKGRLVATLFETKGASRVVVVDLRSGASREVELPGTTGSDALILDRSDDVAWIGTSYHAGLFRLDLRTLVAQRIDALTPLLDKATYVFSLTQAADGVVYAGTYPTGLLLAYDPATGVARSLGQPAPGRRYVRNVLAGESGTIYCGLGTPAALVAVDPRTGRARDLLGGVTHGATFAGSLALDGGKLTATLDQSTRTDPVTVAVADRAAAVAMPQRAQIDLDGAYAVEVEGRAVSGRLDLASKQQGMLIMGLAAGPDGAIYGPTYYNASLFRIDPATAAIRALGHVRGASGQFRAIQSMGEAGLLLPGYGAPLYVYDVRQPWGPDNPRLVGQIGHEQHLATGTDRRADGLVAIATPPQYGRHGGAVTLLDPATMTWRTFTDLVPRQSVASVCFGPGGRVYAGTSTGAGLGEKADRAGRGHLLVLDDKSGGVLQDLVPVDAASAVTALVARDDRHVLGGTNTGVLFDYNVRTLRVRPLATLSQIRGMARVGPRTILVLAWKKGLFRVDPETLQIAQVGGVPDTLLPGIAADAEGRAYVHDGAHVYRVTLD